MRRFGKEFPVLLACALAVTACGGGAGQQGGIPLEEMDEYIELVGLISEKLSLFEEMEASQGEESGSGETEPETPPEDAGNTENTDSSETGNEEG